MENVWHYLRANKLSMLVWDSYEAIVGVCRTHGTSDRRPGPHPLNRNLCVDVR